MAEQPSELTSSLHLSSRDAVNPSAGQLEEYLASLPLSDRAIIQEIQASDGERAMVLINRGENKGARFLISAEGASIGRATASSIFLDDVTVSRVHAVIKKIGEQFNLRDCGSLNGTYVNNESISQLTLNSGDEIQIGKFHLLFVGGRTQVKI